MKGMLNKTGKWIEKGSGWSIKSVVSVRSHDYDVGEKLLAAILEE